MAALSTQHSVLSTQQSVSDATAWLPLAEAARRTGLSERAWRFRCEGELCRRGLARKQANPGGHGRPAWYVHVAADSALRTPHSAPARSVPDLSGYAAHHVANAQCRLHWLKRWQELCDAHPATPKRDLAVRVVAEAAAPNRDREGAAGGERQEARGKSDPEPRLRISIRSLQTWDTAYRRHGLVGLIDRYGAGATARVGTGDGGPHRAPEATRYFYDLYRTNQRRTVRQCHSATLREARRHRWSWPASYSATVRWLDEYDDVATTCLLREGYAAWGHRFRPFITQDYSNLVPGDMYVCDHHQFKCFVRYRKQTIRPWLTAIEDAATRVLVGFHIGPVPHSDAILMSVRNAFETYGVPRRVKIDNGKDFDSKVLTGTTKSELRRLKRELGPDWKDCLRRERAKCGLSPAGWFGVLPEFGCEIIRALPYEPQSKVVERFFRTVTDGFVRDLATFCDTSPERKPEALAEVLGDVSAIPDLEDFRRDFAAWVDEYHATAHRGAGLDGRSPLAAWRGSPVKPAVAQADALALLVSVRGLYKVGANGVSLKLGSVPISYGQYGAQLTRWKGRQVLVAVDPADVSYALIFTPERDTRRLICRAEANEQVPPCAAADDMREAQATHNRALRDAKRARASAASRMKSSARIAREAAARRHAERLRATGTDDATADQPGTQHSEAGPIRVLQTGFEAAAKQVQKVAVATAVSLSGAVLGGEVDDFSEYDQPAPPYDSGDDDDELDEFDLDDEPNPVTDDDDEEDLL